MRFAMKFPTAAIRFNNNWVMLAGAIALGLVATGLIFKYLNDRTAALEAEVRGSHRLVTVVAARRRLLPGTPIEISSFAKRKVPAEYVPASAISLEQFGQYVGRKLISPLGRGDTLLQAYVEPVVTTFSSSLQSGNRALTVEVDEINSISGMLRPADHIDLMATARGTKAQSTEMTFPLLSNVEVLATGQVTHKTPEGSQMRTYTTITLSVAPSDAERIVVAKGSGKLTAVLRNPGDEQANALTAMNIDDVLPKNKVVARATRVQYIVGGQ